MMHRAEQAAFIAQERLVAILRLRSPEGVDEGIDALIDGGFRVIEITFGTPGVLDIIRRCRKRLNKKGVLLGVGTVLDDSAAHAAIEAGASFLVSPVRRTNLIRTAHRHGALMIPGCATPTEMLDAAEAGADFIKVFPIHSLGGPDYIRAILGPLPHLPLLPCGGITPALVGGYLDAGAKALGVGSMLNDDLVRSRAFDTIRDRAHALIRARDAHHSSS